MNKRVVFSAFIFALVLSFVSLTSYAKSSTIHKQETISGKVVNASTGEAIADVEVSIRGTDMSATTDSTGHFTIEGLEAGKYVVVVEQDGYKEYESTVDLSSGSAEITIKLQPESDDSGN